MGLVAWLTRNWADTDAGDDPVLKPLDLSLSRADALARVEAVIRRLPRWQVERVDREAGTLTATRRTWLWRFVDDIEVRCEAIPSGTRIHARSKSRVGKGDLGQNRRNLLKLFRALRDPGSPNPRD
jgi:uncharacterized protein (DUF1499 family)